MILIIEGPNGAGKSTLFDELIKETKRPTRYIHNGPSDRPLHDYTNQAVQALVDQREGTDTIIDRYNVGEQVYPYLYDRERLIEPLEDHILVQALGVLGVRWIILCPPVRRLVLAHRARGEEFDINLIEAERDAFIHYYGGLPPQLKQFFTLVPDDATIPQLLNAVRKLVNP